ncbi:MAG TPA: CRTAC1 family protein [Candidatus Polarisedimenticolia bacterium]|jgi:hypothetical protein
MSKVRFVITVALLTLAASNPGSKPESEEFRAVAERLRSSSNPFFGLAPMKGVQKRLSEPGVQPRERFDLVMRLSFEELREGNTAAAVAAVEEALSLITRAVSNAPGNPRLQESLAKCQLMRGLAYMRHAEVQNCISRHTSRSCILPITGGGVHTIKEPARQARASYEEYLKLKPEDLGVRWLLNLVNMTLGEYPQGVPASLRIDFEANQSKLNIERFVDIAPELGINTFDLAGGVVAEDFDDDGFLDIVTSTSDPSGGLTYFRNLGTGRFEDLTSAARLDQQMGGLNMIGADYDNDRDPDLLVLRGGWLFEDGRIRNSLLRNNGDGTFTDVTRKAGLAEPAYPTQAAVWGDFDNDGDPDLYIGNEASGTQDNPGPAYPAQLFRNNGDGSFTDVAAAAGVTNDRMAKGVTAGDYDNDGDLDIYISNIGENRLYRNNGDGSFKDVAPELGLTEPKGRSFAPWFFDYDNDGWLDLWVSAYDALIADIAADYLGLPHQAHLPCLYHNKGDGTFVDVAVPMGLGHPYRPMGANFGDIDNDGYLDIYLGTGDPDYRSLVPNIMLRNDGGKRFQDVTTSGGFGHLQKGHGIAFADFDHDGDEDIYHQLGGFVPGDKFGNVLFMNPGHGGHQLSLKLVGVQSNRAGIGARIKVVVQTPTGTREIHRAVGSVSSFGGSPLLRQEIGLGDATRIVELLIWWPKSGLRQTLRDVPIDSFVEVTEGSSEIKRLPLKRFAFPPPSM